MIQECWLVLTLGVLVVPLLIAGLVVAEWGGPAGEFLSKLTFVLALLLLIIFATLAISMMARSAGWIIPEPHPWTRNCLCPQWHQAHYFAMLAVRISLRQDQTEGTS